LALGPQPTSGGLMSMSSSLGRTPEDVQSLAYAELKALETKFKKALSTNLKLDDYTRAHLVDSQERIKKVLSAQLTTTRP
jgi:hypothetical protein